MKTIQEIFKGRFRNCSIAVVQRCDDNIANRLGLASGYAEHWPTLPMGTSLIAIAVGNRQRREIWRGLLIDEVPSLKYENLYRLIVDRFEYVGTHDLTVISDADFYSNNGGGGSRVKVARASATRRTIPSSIGGILGENEKREVWVRKNHDKFRDPVYRYWEGKCAVFDHRCNGLLVASHIKPWSLSTPEERVNPHNGILLSVALDKLFDTGLIGFSDSGSIVLSSRLEEGAMVALGVNSRMALCAGKVTRQMRAFLRWHRSHFNL